MRRTNVVRLVLDKNSEAKLKALCSLASKLWNEVNYARRRQFFEKKVDFKVTYREFYEKYKTLIGSATAQQILNKNNEAWKSFFSLLKAKREGKVPAFRINPPSYKKRHGSRALWVVLRNDQYRIEENKIILKGLGAIGRVEVQYRGLIHVKGKQGRMEIHYDPDSKKWYVHITFEVYEKAVRGAWRKVPATPNGSLRAGVDIGINNLFAVNAEDGEAFLINGRPLKSISHYWEIRVAKYQSMLNKYGLKTSHKLRIIYKKWRRKVKHYINTAVRRLAEKIYSISVSTVYVGYPKMISQNNGNFNTVQIWNYGYLLRRLSDVLEEYGISVVFVDEAYTSSRCPFHGNKCGKRITRGLFKCTTTNKVFNADIVGAYNILVKGITITPSPREGIGVIGRRPDLRLNPKGDLAPNLPALAIPRTLTL
ncbi:MAG: transposase [Caldisphaeraceae archaeon]|nr:transposase [Caldisphaeraceae archaeon]MEB3692211.1 transposase [Caldisphaeraceae archaeon]MEB3797659.1 transposase [Caldisphaeraceae archaeon]